jgi:hypothetical protein
LLIGLLMITSFWNMMLYRQVGFYQHFRGTCCLHLRDSRISWAWKGGTDIGLGTGALRKPIEIKRMAKEPVTLRRTISKTKQMEKLWLWMNQWEVKRRQGRQSITAPVDQQHGRVNKRKDPTLTEGWVKEKMRKEMKKWRKERIN